MSETARYRHLVEKYCTGCGLDVGSGGDPVVPWAWQLDLKIQEFARYHGEEKLAGPIQIAGDAANLPVQSGSLDFVFASHLLEDFSGWIPVLTEWVRVLKPGGKLIILVPDHERFLAAVAGGQPDNPNHRHECDGPGELSSYADRLGLKVIEDRFTDLFPGDYSVLFVASRL